METKRSQTLSSTWSDYCSSPEFEFWMVRNPSFPEPNILSADELFVNGVLLPLHLVSKPDPPPQNPHPDPQPEPSPAVSKRWKDIFRKNDKKNNNAEENEKDKDKGNKKEKKGGATASAAELNINIWPFSRSRSAGTRPKLFPGAPVTRKVNSAPCSRSNSAGDSKSRKWPSSPGRTGVHIGRSSPVWQVRRGGKSPPELNPENNNYKWSKIKRESNRRSKVASSSDGSAKARVLNLNVPMCIAYRNHLSCRSDDNSTIGVSDIHRSNSGGHGHGHGHAKFFNLRTLFTKKTLVTSH